MSVGGQNAIVTEVVCATPTTPGGTCSGGSPLTTLLVESGQNLESATFNPVTTVYIFKDIKVEKPGDLTSFSQSFHTVPEPGVFALSGIGLLALGVLRRSRRR
jgi:hypothetical protein